MNEFIGCVIWNKVAGTNQGIYRENASTLIFSHVTFILLLSKFIWTYDSLSYNFLLCTLYM